MKYAARYAGIKSAESIPRLQNQMSDDVIGFDNVPGELTRDNTPVHSACHNEGSLGDPKTSYACTSTGGVDTAEL